MKKRTKPPIPPCPDPEKYILVQTKEGNFWRRKRGTVSQAGLNNSFANNARNFSIASPAARQIILKLEPFLRGLKTGRLTARILGRLVKCLNQKERIELSALKDFDFQPEYPFDRTFRGNILVEQEQAQLVIRFELYENILNIHSSLVTDYYFDAILLYGDPVKKNGLQVKNDTSRLIAFDAKDHSLIELKLELPDPADQWIVLLKFNSHEGNELARHSKYYGLKTVSIQNG